MANAIHKTESGDTLDALAEVYFYLRTPKGQVMRRARKRVTAAIRTATPTDLSGFTDSADLGADKVLYIPTLREFNRALRVDDSDVLSKLEGLGLNHARRLLKLSLSEVLELADPASDPNITDTEVTRAYVITQFFNLDGMDALTADYLFDTQGVVTLESLGQQTVTTLNSMLATLVSSESRPSALTQQDHARRWRLEARLYTRAVVSDHLINTRTRTFPVPVPPQHHQRSAEHFAQVGRDLNQRPNRRAEADALATVHRFAAGYLAGNQALHLKRWPQAVGFYNSAQRAVHRWLELRGSDAVDDIAGVNLYDAIDGTRQLLDALPDDREPALGGPAATWQGRDTAGVVYGVRGFRYSELTSTEQSNLRTSLSSVFIRQLPRQYREELGRVVMDLTLGALNTVDTNLTIGLDSYPAQSRAQDLTAVDKARLMRNLGGVTVNRLYTSGGIGVFDDASLAARLFLWSVKDLVGSLWNASSASSVLATTPKLDYTTALLSESPFARFVEMPGLTVDSTSQFVVLKATASAFFAEYENNFLVPRLKSTSAADIYFPRAVWESPSAIALLMPWVYGRYVLMGLHSAHNHQGQSHSGDNYAIKKVNSYDTSGALIGTDTHELEASHPAQYTDSPVDEQDTGSQAVWEEMQAEVLAAIDEADTLYRRGDLDGGHVAYELARDIIVTNQGSVYAGDLEEEVEQSIDGLGPGGTGNGRGGLSIFEVDFGGFLLDNQVFVMRDPTGSRGS